MLVISIFTVPVIIDFMTASEVGSIRRVVVSFIPNTTLVMVIDLNLTGALTPAPPIRPAIAPITPLVTALIIISSVPMSSPLLLNPSVPLTRLLLLS